MVSHKNIYFDTTLQSFRIINYNYFSFQRKKPHQNRAGGSKQLAYTKNFGLTVVWTGNTNARESNARICGFDQNTILKKIIENSFLY